MQDLHCLRKEVRKGLPLKFKEVVEEFSEFCYFGRLPCCAGGYKMTKHLTTKNKGCIPCIISSVLKMDGLSKC